MRTRRIPDELELLTEWLQRQFGHWVVDEDARNKLDRIFNNTVHRGNARDIWFNVLWNKVQKLRIAGASWQDAANTALDTWTIDDPILPPVWSDPTFREKNHDKLLNLTQRLKNRRENISDLGIEQVTDAHFWIALVAGRHCVAARLYRAAKPQLRAQFCNQLLRMASPTAH